MLYPQKKAKRTENNKIKQPNLRNFPLGLSMQRIHNRRALAQKILKNIRWDYVTVNNRYTTLEIPSRLVGYR